ncbi:MAG: hypothetical protein WBA12_00345 [Catalinimonas sp.]
MPTTFQPNPDWDHLHYLAYVYICVARADLRLDRAERNLILRKVHSYRIDKRRRVEEVFDEVLFRQLTHTWPEVYAHVAHYCRTYAPTDAKERAALSADLEHIMVADGVVKSTEEEVYRVIRGLLDEAETS